MTVSAVAKLMPKPPARVESKKQKSCADKYLYLMNVLLAMHTSKN